ncbi:protein of unknown function [Candidatus Methylacidiphilum fumarolicum]|uniref:Uncharacterized protein n=1 Tax=Candidatus Methylacidiphilum fumarolicum TaxID=591154 RepID=A0ABM9IBA2_9BACT|nr:protein of unknown function [Candidatus Methylacidiphilum fumarolicum]
MCCALVVFYPILRRESSWVLYHQFVGTRLTGASLPLHLSLLTVDTPSDQRAKHLHRI